MKTLNDRTDDVIRVKVIRVTLLDSSHVYDVHVTDCDAAPLVINAYDELHACDMAQRLADAININSSNRATWYQAY